MVIGCSLAFDEGNRYVGGLGKILLNGMTVDALYGTTPDSLFIVFQMTFAINPTAGFVTPGGALCIGAIYSVACYWGVARVKY